MSRAKFEIAYDGVALNDHKMDVYQLAPALLALGDLIREANQQVNGDKSKINVLVQSDFEHKCFNVNFEVVQTIIEQVKTFLQDDNVKTAKDMGIIPWRQVARGSSPCPWGVAANWIRAKLPVVL